MMAHNISNNSMERYKDDMENRSDVLNQTSNSLQDGQPFDMIELNDGELWNAGVTDLLDDPCRLKLHRNSKFEGFDHSLGDSWIYPTNYPIRQYQFTITQAALFKNTLVVLPTGLGKTFIAAVVMYNIYRWFPTGKVLFMAPTCALVCQQIEACYRIMGIPRNDTADMTWKKSRNERFARWQTKRVFCATPQVVLADLESPQFPTQQVRLVVIDEAHRAKGKNAFVDVVQRLAMRNPYFRVLALSATPGRTLDDVGQVISNLLISHVEIRWENSVDVLPYVFRNNIRTIVIPLGQTIVRIRQELQRLVNPYLQRLFEANVFVQYPSTVTAGLLMMRHNQFRQTALRDHHPNQNTILADFAVCISMYCALELLVKHGIRAFLNFFDDGTGMVANKQDIVAKHRQIKRFLDELREQFHHRQQQHQQQQSTGLSIVTGNDDIDFGHPKYRILEQQLMTFFKEFPDSKAIVFCEFRDSVPMIKRMLCNNPPLIRPNCIVGQGGANSVKVAQQEQLDVMRQFRSGTINTLIATSVAEQGIDVGEVDLIVCFDIAENTMQFVQRMGLTGGQRAGRVWVLATEGEEHETLQHVLATKEKTNQQLTCSKDILRFLHPCSPRLIPDDLRPKCAKMSMNIPDEQASPNRSCSIKNSNRKRNVNRTKYDTNGQPPTKRKRSVKDFFPQRQIDPVDGLNVSEREILAEELPNQRNTSHPGNTSIVADQSIREGHTDIQIAIDARMQPLARINKQFSQQKYLYGRKLLNPVRSEHLERQEAPKNTSVSDDQLDLRQLNRLESTTHGNSPRNGVRNSSEAAIVREQKSSPTRLGKSQKPNTITKDIYNSPQQLAFNRSVQNAVNSDSFAACTANPPSQRTSEPRISDSQRSVLEYFHLPSLEALFEDESSDELVLCGGKAANVEDFVIEDSDDDIFQSLKDKQQPSWSTQLPNNTLRTDSNTESVQSVRHNAQPERIDRNSTARSYVESDDDIFQSSDEEPTTNTSDRGEKRVFQSESSNDNRKVRSSSQSTDRNQNALLRLQNFTRDNITEEDFFGSPNTTQYFVDSYLRRTPDKHLEDEQQPSWSTQLPNNTLRTDSNTESVQSVRHNAQPERIDRNSTARSYVESDDDIFQSSDEEPTTNTSDRGEKRVFQSESSNDNRKVRSRSQSTDRNQNALLRLQNFTRDKITEEDFFGSPNTTQYFVDSYLRQTPDKHLEDEQQPSWSTQLPNNTLRTDSNTESVQSVRHNAQPERIDRNSTARSYVESDDDIFQSSDEEPTVNASDRGRRQSNVGKHKQRKAKRSVRNFLHTQAAVSDDPGSSADDESEDIGSLNSFVCATDDEPSTVDMRAVYLQSLRSPLPRHGAFKTAANGPPRGQFPPIPSDRDAHYIEDEDDEQDSQHCSFINDSISMCSESEQSVLEMAEQLLEARRRKKRQTKRSLCNSFAGQKRRRRIIVNSPSS